MTKLSPSCSLQGAIEFKIAEDNSGQSGFTLPVAAIAARAIDNCRMEYNSVKPYPHTLQAPLGSITQQATPVGLSFSSGNSDPRATEFQKADVILITGSLTANGNARKSANQAA